jgi:hypothetical protein
LQRELQYLKDCDTVMGISGPPRRPGARILGGSPQRAGQVAGGPQSWTGDRTESVGGPVEMKTETAAEHPEALRKLVKLLNTAGSVEIRVRCWGRGVKVAQTLKETYGLYITTFTPPQGYQPGGPVR